jgi:hypothetical protein
VPSPLLVFGLRAGDEGVRYVLGAP